MFGGPRHSVWRPEGLRGFRVVRHCVVQWSDLVVGDVGVLPGLGQQAVVPEDGAVVEPIEP